MKFLTTITAAFALSVMALSFVACSNKKNSKTEPETVKPVNNSDSLNNNSDSLNYGFQDASVAPQYHRSYTIKVTPPKVYLVVTSYDQLVLKDSFALTRAAYDSFSTALDNLHIRDTIETKPTPCTGGTSENFDLYPGSSREVKGYIHYCGGRKNGNLGGDLVSATLLFRAMVPDLNKRIEATKKNE